MPHTTFTGLIIAASLLATPASAETPQDAASAAARGQIDFTYNRSSSTLAAADRTPLQAQGVKLRDLLLAAPALRDPHGFSLHSSVVLERPVASRAPEPDVVRGTVQSRRVDITRTKPDSQGRYPGTGEGPALLFEINRLEAALGYRNDAGFFNLPAKREEQDGLLRLVRAGRELTVVTRLGITAYQPVSIADYAADMIRTSEAGGSPELAATMRAAIAQLTPAQLQAPYCKSSALETVDLAGRCRHPGAELVVRLNPALAPGVGGASKARLIVLSAPQVGTLGDARERRRLLLAVSQLDVAGLRALLT